MQLIKLVYIAHGWHLGLTSKPLVNENVQAWQYGPVLESLYRAYRCFGSGVIPAGLQAFPVALENESALAPFLDSVWKAYSKYSGGQLSTLTHVPGTPWDITWNKNGGCQRRGAVIENDLIREHYQQKANARAA